MYNYINKEKQVERMNKMEMTIISSQKHRDYRIINEKIEELSGAESVDIPVINAHYKDLEDNDLYIVVDKHHTLCAAIELGLTINYIEVEDSFTPDDEIERENGEMILKCNRIDSEYYYIDTDYDNAIGPDVW